MIYTIVATQVSMLFVIVVQMLRLDSLLSRVQKLERPAPKDQDEKPPAWGTEP